MNLRNWALATSLCLALGVAYPSDTPSTAAAPTPEKIFRYAFQVAETGFDPAQTSDLYSATVEANLFDAPYKYDYLARPVKVRPNLAEALPEISDNFRTFTFRLRRGIYFADDPAFEGKKREVTAADFVFSLKRFFDPATKSPNYSGLHEEGILGLDALRKKAEATGKFDYDSEAEGLRALDRYTVQIKLAEPRPRFINNLADPTTTGHPGARGGREVRRAHHGAPGGHRPLHPEGMAAFVGDGLRAQPQLPRGVLRRRAGPGRRGRAGDRRAHEGQAHADGGQGHRVRHRRAAAALARLPEPRARFHGAPAAELRHAGDPQQQAGAQPRQARDPDGPGAAVGPDHVLFPHGQPGGRRLHTREGGPAPRDLAGAGQRGGSAAAPSRPGHHRPGVHPAQHVQLRCELPHRDGHLRQGAGHRAARHVRLHRQERRRLARHARRQPAGAARWTRSAAPITANSTR